MSQLYLQEAALARAASSDVEFGDGPFSAALCALLDGTLAVVFHLWEVFVEHLPGSECGHQIVEFSILLAVLFGLPGFSFLLTLFLELFTQYFRLFNFLFNVCHCAAVRCLVYSMCTTQCTLKAAYFFWSFWGPYLYYLPPLNLLHAFIRIHSQIAKGQGFLREQITEAAFWLCIWSVYIFWHLVRLHITLSCGDVLFFFFTLKKWVEKKTDLTE